MQAASWRVPGPGNAAKRPLAQLLVSRACPQAIGHTGPRLPQCVLPGRGSLWEGGLGEGGRGEAGPILHFPLFPTQGEDARLEARATLSSQCGLGQLVALSGPQVPLPHNPGASQGSLHADHPVLGTLVPGQGAVRTGGHKRAPELHPTGSQDHEASRWGSGGLGGDLPAGAESLGIGQRYRCPFPGKAFIHNLALFISQQH